MIRFWEGALLVCLTGFVAQGATESGRVMLDLSGDGWTCDGEHVSVPHTWNATDACDGPGETVKLWTGEKGGDSVGGLGYLKKRAVYRRTLPAKRTGRRYFLRFEGASVVADVKVSGRKVGSHVGAFTAFAFEVTDFLKTDGESELEVAVDNRWREDTQPMAADYSVYGGLYRKVWLIETDSVCIDPVADGADGVTVLADPKTGEVTVEVAVLGGTNEVQKFRVENHELWSPESPRLYTRRIAIDQKGSHDAVDIRFGFRTFEFRDGIFHLNGVRRQLRGVNRHQDRAGKGWAVSAADEEEDIRLMKEMGVDALRTAHYPQSRHIYDLCDELGIICWVEYPNVNRLTFSAAFEDGLRRQVREMVAQHRNHPCVAMWGMFNELYNGEEWMKPHARELEAMMTRMRDLIHELDPSRTVVGVMGEAGIPSLNAIPDEYGLNVYPKWYSNLTMREMLAWLFRDSGRRTFSISEYGVGASVRHHGDPAAGPSAAGMWHPEEYQAFRMHDNLLEMMREPRIWGTYIWAMFDFGADNRREGDREGINDKGLVTHDRRTKKDAFYLYQANWTKTPTLHLVGQHMTATTNRTLSVMGFSNMGPVTLRVNGKKLGTKTPDAACGVIWPAVELQTGDNEIALEANGFEERRRWRRDAERRVDSLNTNLTALVCLARHPCEVRENLFDFGKAAFGWLELHDVARGDYEVTIGEMTNAEGHVANPCPGSSIRTYSVTCRVDSARQVVALPIDRLNTTGWDPKAPSVLLPPKFPVVAPFRYAEVTKGEDRVGAANLVRQMVHYPIDMGQSSFSCDNEILNEVYELCKHTILATSFCGVYVDGDRERTPYEADAYINQLCQYAIDADYSLARRSHEWLMDHPTWPTEWKQHSIKMAWADWMWTGDTRSLAKNYERLQRKLLGNYPRRDIVDWPPSERDGFVMTNSNSVVDAFNCRNLVEMSEIAAALGKREDAERYAREADMSRMRFVSDYFDSERGLFRDAREAGHMSLHANAAALAFGLVPPDRVDGVASYLAEKGLACSVYFAQYLLEALFEAGRSDVAVKLMASTGERSWKAMIDFGSTMTMEAWNVRAKPNLDLNHAWGAAPLNLISRYVLGVTPLKPGFEELSVRPQVGGLRRVRGVVPTSKGPVEVKIDDDVLAVTVPAIAKVVWKGRTSCVEAGEHRFW